MAAARSTRSSTAPARVVVKIGSAVLAESGGLSLEAVRRIADDIAALRSRGTSVVVVSSGAIASGFRALGLARPPKLIREKQAAAAIGQQRLMAAYAAAFEPHATVVGQVLLTAEDFDHRLRFLNARHTLETLLDHAAVPIINENDSVSFAEIKLGDNDRLAALTAAMLRADLLVMLSTAPGLWASGTRSVIPLVENVEDARRHVRPTKSGVGTGGMTTKLDAAALVTGLGIPCVVAPGNAPNVLARIVSGESLGTRFAARPSRLSSRRRWIGFTVRSRGTLHIDAGAARAVRDRGASLLPSGILAVEGDFEAGSVVDILCDKAPVARGLSAYSSDEVSRIKGRRASTIAAVLGYSHCDEVVHRDDLLVTAQTPEAKS
ncbi:MAG: glutamate 5-kinase [Phycisphaerales bacterium]|nr:glutamate 5-kinase [Phycisphaerales bacterium]